MFQTILEYPTCRAQQENKTDTDRLFESKIGFLKFGFGSLDFVRFWLKDLACAFTKRSLASILDQFLTGQGVF
jgi:hypothetical protein